MAIRYDLMRRIRQALIPLLGFCLLSYFVYHAIQGDRGIIAWLSLKQQLRLAEADAGEIAEERAVLENLVARLSPASLDPDLLEERGRLMLNLAEQDEVVIMLDRSQVAPASDEAPAN